MDVIRDHLTRHITGFFDQFRDEIILSFDDLIPSTSGTHPLLALVVGYSVILTVLEWTSIDAFRTMLTVIARVSSRVFVGMPLCKFRSVFVTLQYLTSFITFRS